MPIPVCKFERAHFSKTFSHDAAYGKCVSKKETYYSFNLHALIALDGYLTDFTLIPGNIDDSIAVWDLTENLRFPTIIGDRGYLGNKLASDLESENSVRLISLKRNNSKSLILKRFRQMIFKARKVQTTFSHLSEQLNIQRVLTKSMWGLISSRISTKILAHNICYFINKTLNIKPDISRIKDLIFS